MQRAQDTCNECGGRLEFWVSRADPAAQIGHCTNKRCANYFTPLYKADNWKRELADVLKKYGKVDESTVGELALTINQGGVRDAIWLKKKIE